MGPLSEEGAYIIGAVLGYGIMSACAAGEPLAHHIKGVGLPEYAPALLLSRYENAEYLKGLVSLEDNSGEL